MQHRIWKTPEADAWSRGFNYAEYVNTICKYCKITPISENLYRALCTAFEDEMEREIGCQQKNLVQGA